jgi:hypothetical protein
MPNGFICLRQALSPQQLGSVIRPLSIVADIKTQAMDTFVSQFWRERRIKVVLINEYLGL